MQNKMKRRITLTQGSPDGAELSMNDSSGTADRHDGQWSLSTAIAVIARRRRFLMTAVLSVAIVTAAITLMISNKYVSTASILPSGGQDKMADLKSLAGLGSLMGNDENSSELFPTIIASQTIRGAVLGRQYQYHDDNHVVATSLAEYLNEENPDKLRRALASITRAASDKKTGVITIAVETEFPELSQGIVRAYLEELETFNLTKRTSKGKESAEYLAAQLDIKRGEVESAEDSLEYFQSVNRDWATSGSPEVLKITTRLQRELQVKTIAYGYLQQQFEMARLDAQRDVPIIRILDPATLPTEKSSPMRTLIVLAMTLAAFLCSIFWILASEAWKRNIGEAGSDGPQTLNSEIETASPRLRRVAKGDSVVVDSQ
jgi:uncharacterized protein involved in exopolysaccharide biosynthesis